MSNNINKYGSRRLNAERQNDSKSISRGDFVCRSCGARVSAESWGTTQRNHCPHCLCSVHLDNMPGDRSASCGGVMEPIGVWVKKNGEWAIIHRCRECGKICANRIAGDDNPLLLMSIAVKPLASPPFPLGVERQINDLLKVNHND